MAAVAALHSEFQSLQAHILAISTDSVYSHKIFTQVSPSASQVSYPLVSDRTQAISRQYRIMNPRTGAAFRGTFIIDPDGRITTKLVYPLEVGRNAHEILRILQGIQYGRNTGEGVPANWMPGDPGIERNPDNIGRI